MVLVKKKSSLLYFNLQNLYYLLLLYYFLEFKWNYKWKCSLSLIAKFKFEEKITYFLIFRISRNLYYFLKLNFEFVSSSYTS